MIVITFVRMIRHQFVRQLPKRKLKFMYSKSNPVLTLVILFYGLHFTSTSFFLILITSVIYGTVLLKIVMELGSTLVLWFHLLCTGNTKSGV